MEKGIRLLDFETTDQMLQIHDYEGVSLSSRDANSKRAASEATEIFTNYYPEFLVGVFLYAFFFSRFLYMFGKHKKWFVNVPTFMSWLFWAFKPFLPTRTFSKMSVVGHGAAVISQDLLPYISKEQLPERYGGEAQAF